MKSCTVQKQYIRLIHWPAYLQEKSYVEDKIKLYLSQGKLLVLHHCTWSIMVQLNIFMYYFKKIVPFKDMSAQTVNALLTLINSLLDEQNNKKICIFFLVDDSLVFVSVLLSRYPQQKDPHIVLC